MIIESRNFKTRLELNQHIASEYGMNSSANQELDLVIQGTEEDFAGKLLSNNTHVYGIKCLIIK